MMIRLRQATGWSLSPYGESGLKGLLGRWEQEFISLSPYGESGLKADDVEVEDEED